VSDFEEHKIRYAYNGKPQQWQWGFKSGWDARQGEIDGLKVQLECCQKEGEKIDSLVESFISHTEQFGFESDEAETALRVLRGTLQGHKCVNVVFIAKSPTLSYEEERGLRSAMQRAVVIKSFPDIYWTKNDG